MLLRLGILSVLFLGLSGILPAATACAVMMQQQADCCPDGHPPCDPAEVPSAPSTPSMPAPCCFTAPAPASAAVAPATVERRDLQGTLDDWAEPLPSFAAATRDASRASQSAARTPPSHQQLLYLRTGRLRL